MRVDAHTLPVDQVRLGDHAFACYADDDVRWETAALFAAGGRGLGYKVIVVPDPAVSRPEAASAWPPSARWGRRCRPGR